MILDRQNLVSDNQNLAQAAGSYVSTDAIDTTGGVFASPGGFGTIPRDAARGEEVPFFVQVTETFTSGGAGTLAVELIQSANADLSSPTVLASTPAQALATLVAGYRFRVTAPRAGITARYLGVRYVIATATMTAGKCTAGIAQNLDTSPQTIR
jgi:hypothetical protein